MFVLSSANDLRVGSAGQGRFLRCGRGGPILNFSGFQPPAGLLDSIFDSMPEQAAILDENGVVQWVNEAWTSFAASNGGDSAATGVGS